MKNKLLFILAAVLLAATFTSCNLLGPKKPEKAKDKIIQYTVFIVDTIKTPHPEKKYYVKFDKFSTEFDLSVTNFFNIDHSKLSNKDSLEVKVFARDTNTNDEYFMSWYMDPIDFAQADCGPHVKTLYKSVVLNNPDFQRADGYIPPTPIQPVPIGRSGSGTEVPQ